MKTMIISFAAIIVIAIGAYFVLENLGFSSAQFAAGPDVRLGQSVD